MRRGDAGSSPVSATSTHSNTNAVQAAQATVARGQLHSAQPPMNNLASASIPLDSSGNPLPWSRESIVRWARANGFDKFVPAFVQHGIEGYMFYALKLEDMREMRIPNVSMQDLIQLNAAIYRLNVAAATPANRSHMTGTLREQNNTQRSALLQEEILGRPLHPLRPPRPSWTVRRDDPQPTYTHQVQLTSNGMVARPVRVRPPPHQQQSQQQPQLQQQKPPQQQKSPQHQQHQHQQHQHQQNQQPLPQHKPLPQHQQPQQHFMRSQQNAVPRPPQAGSPHGPAPVHVVAPPQPSARPPENGSKSSVIVYSQQLTNVEPLNPTVQLQHAQKDAIVLPPVPFSINTGISGPNTGAGSSQTSSGGATARWTTRSPYSRDTDRYGSSYRSRNSAHVEIDELPFVRPNQTVWANTPQKSGQNSALSAAQRRRSAVVEVFDDHGNAETYPGTAPDHPGRAPRASSGGSAAAPGLPARYHGTNQPHSSYYAHGSSGTGTFSYRGVSAPATRTAYKTASGAGKTAPAKFHTHQPQSNQHRSRVHGLFEHDPQHANREETSTQRPIENKTGRMESGSRKKTPHARRTSLSPVLTALQPGNYHIANLPDADLDSSSEASDSSEPPKKPQDKKASQGSAVPRANNGLLAINTSLLYDIQASPCDTGDSTITPLSVVNVLPGALSSNTSPSLSHVSHASHTSYDAVVPVEGNGREPHYGDKSAGNRTRLQRAFGDEMEDLPVLQLPRTGHNYISGHVRSPSLPAPLDQALDNSPDSIVHHDAAGVRPHSTIDPDSYIGVNTIDSVLDSQLALQQNNSSYDQQVKRTYSPVIFDAESVASSDEEDKAFKNDSHHDLVENAVPVDSMFALQPEFQEQHASTISYNSPPAGDELEVWDAEEIVEGSNKSVRSLLILDAEEITDDSNNSARSFVILDAEEVSDDEENTGFRRNQGRDDRSSVHIDAYETASIFSNNTHNLQQPDMDAANNQHAEEASAMPVPLNEAGRDESTLDSAGGSPSLNASASSGDQKQSTAFKVMGVRHLFSYGSDFDKTAASVLSSIKTDIAKKVASGETNDRSAASAASIAAAIEYHQQKQQQKDAPNSGERYYTSRLSGFFGFGQRANKSSVLQPLSNPKSQQQTRPQSPTSTPGLRVVTDLNTLRNSSEAGSAEGKKSASPSTVQRRWRVPFRQRTPASAAVPGSSATGGVSASDADERTQESEISATSKVSSLPRRDLRRSRYRAGTTSDIESPQTSAAVLSAIDRPYSMVESSTTSSGRTTPRSAGNARGLLLRQRKVESLVDIQNTQTAVVYVRREQDAEFVPVDISRLVSGASVAERLVRTVNLARSAAASTGSWQFVVQSPSGSQCVGSESELWTHCLGSTPESPAKFVVCESGSNSNAFTVQETREDRGHSGVRFGHAPHTGASASDSLSPNSSSSANAADEPPPPIERADSWTLMFFSKEFVVPQTSTIATPSSSGQNLSTTYTSPGDSWSASAKTVLPDEAQLEEGLSVAERLSQDRHAETEETELTDNDSVAVQAELQDDARDDCRSIASSMLPSTMSFTRGMRATLLERQPSRNIKERPTADVIGDQLDEYFPGHDLDRPIVQAVPVDDRLHEFHIILDEEARQKSMTQEALAQQRRQHRRHEPFEAAGLGRRKSVRMLVQESRKQRRGYRQQRRQEQQAPEVGGSESPARVDNNSMRAAVVRRKSTKLWGCIPEEIRPRSRRFALDGSSGIVQLPQSAGVGERPKDVVQQPLSAEQRLGNDEIVRRALSLLRKPEPNPQAEKEIVEEALKCGDNSTAGSTRAQFVREQALQRGDDSVNETVRALFAKYGIVAAGIRFQWIKGKLIGKGSFGHVYVALNAGTGEVIAVKQIQLPRSLSSKANRSVQLEEAIQMMYTEVELLQDLDHENIVQLLGFEVSQCVMSMFLEYVPGGTVQSLVQQHGPLPESVVHSFVRQILSGLGYLHERGVLHRDIKGANILVDETGTCKISDFGISRKADAGATERRVLGTVPFMAPEVARASQYTEAADIWSLGCVVVQMWAGRGPWDELQEPQVFFKLGKGLAPPIPDDLTEAGIEFCKNCFGADPLARWTAAELSRMEFAQVPVDYEYPYR
ncbi:hypothetical protein GGI25_005958 [Coemansia spiralis]|uniref:Protein kinase domain-containing protein n=2 Tax=Coemansia TaxID=4863 RepID=A0A9W8G2Z0_9FUNG|nr:hypothetical protein GGI25_005958 [Coemansia spiralis]